MTYINTKDYIKRKLSGEDIVSPATHLGYKAVTSCQAVDNFMVVVINTNNLYYYVYSIEGSKFCVKDYKELLEYSITNIIPTEILQNKDAMKWWKYIFYEHDNVCTYDSFYDDLRISDDSTITFKDIIERLSVSFSSLHLPTGVSQLLLIGEIASNPLLRYVFQNQFASLIVKVFPDFTENGIPDENEIVILPKERLDNLTLNVHEPVNFSMLVSTPLNITLPLDSLASKMLSDIRWEDILVDKQADYCVGDLSFKMISLRVESDSFQNIFLICNDLRGNRKVIKFN